MDEQVRRIPEEISTTIKIMGLVQLFQAVDRTRVALVVFSCLGSTMVGDLIILLDLSVSVIQ